MKHLMGLSCALFVAACGVSEDGATEPETSNPDVMALANPGPAEQVPEVADPGAADQAAPRAGTLPAPTLTTNGSSTATVTTSLAGSGLRIDGGTAAAAYAMATYPIATGAMRATASFTVNPAAGAAFVYTLRGTGSGYSSQQLRIQRVPGSDALQAAAANGIVTCGTLPSGQPTPVTLAFDGTTKTFDVRIAGAASACTHLPTQVGGPVMGFRVMDAANEGYGGRVELTNLALVF
jgi:hypothetical protein